MADYTVLIDSAMADDAVYLQRGVSLHGLGQYEEALPDVEKSIELNPDYAKGYHRKADLLSALDKNDEALENFEIAIGMAPGDPAAYTCRGRLYLKQKAYQKAITAFNRAIGMDPYHFYSLYKRGMYYLNRKRYREAVEDLDMLIELEPPYLSYKYKMRACMAMGWANYKSKAYFRAVADLAGAWKMRRHLDSLNKRIIAAENHR